jgi:hypothetical protein
VADTGYYGSTPDPTPASSYSVTGGATPENDAAAARAAADARESLIRQTSDGTAGAEHRYLQRRGRWWHSDPEPPDLDAPILTRLQPTSAPTGANFTLQAIGDRFTEDSIVVLGGVELDTTYPVPGAGMLQGHVEGGAGLAAGEYPVVVRTGEHETVQQVFTFDPLRRRRRSVKS